MNQAVMPPAPKSLLRCSLTMFAGVLCLSFLPLMVESSTPSNYLSFAVGWSLGRGVGAGVVAIMWGMGSIRLRDVGWALRSSWKSRGFWWMMIGMTVAHLDIMLFGWATERVDAAVPAIIYGLVYIGNVWVISRMFAGGRGRYRTPTRREWASLLASFVGLALVSMGAVGTDAGTPEALSRIGGVALGIGAMLCGTLNALCYRAGSDIRQALGEPGGRDRAELSCVLLALSIPALAFAIFGAGAGVAMGIPLRWEDMGGSFLFGATAITLGTVLTRRAVISTSNLIIQGLGFTQMLMGTLWLWIFVSIEVESLKLLLLGAGCVVAGNVAGYALGQSRCPQDT